MRRGTLHAAWGPEREGRGRVESLYSRGTAGLVLQPVLGRQNRVTKVADPPPPPPSERKGEGRGQSTSLLFPFPEAALPQRLGLAYNSRKTPLQSDFVRTPKNVVHVHFFL